LLPDDGQEPHPADELLLPAADEALAALDDLGPEHGGPEARPAVREGHRRGGRPAWAMRWIGPLLLACLAELGATPAARAALTKGAKAATRYDMPAMYDRLQSRGGRSALRC
jgi:hypothetical protein